MAKPRFTIDEIEEALKATFGLAAPAARHLTKATGRPCTRRTVDNYIARHRDRLRPILDEARATVVDLAEHGLIKGVIAGRAWAVKTALFTLGRDRGYVTKVEQSGRIEIEPVNDLDLSGLSVEELEQLEQLLAKAAAAARPDPGP